MNKVLPMPSGKGLVICLAALTILAFVISTYLYQTRTIPNDNNNYAKFHIK